MELRRPIRVGPETPRAHATAYLALHDAERAAQAARDQVTRFEDAERFGADNRTFTVVVQVNERESKAVTMIPPRRSARGGTSWEYIVSDVAS